MNWWQAMVLGVVEGVTEYLPVSSTGHLLLAQRALGIPDDEAARAYAIVIQGGAIVAVLGLYRARVAQMVRGLLGADVAGRRLVTAVVAAFVPAAAIGLLLEDTIKEYLFGGARWGLWPTVAAWLLGGAAILAIARRRRARGVAPGDGADLERLGIRGAVVIGVAQCLAMWPGTSRSLVTILGGLLVGLNVPSAVEFSFLLGVVTLGAATAHDALRHGDAMLARYDPGVMAVGFVCAWLSAVLAIRWMVAWLNRHGLAVFGWYRVALAVVVTALLAAGWLDPTLAR